METSTIQPLLDFSAARQPKPELQQLVHVGAGWQQALPDLAGKGRRWFVSPWVNSGKTDLTELLALVEPGDRLIIRGRPEDFIQKMSSLSALERFAERGVEMKRVKHLHAKVYVRESSEGVVWLGSANLTRRGSDGNMRAHTNIEAMSGPHALDPRTLSWLEKLWAYAQDFTVDGLKSEIAELEQDDLEIQRQLAERGSGVLTLQVNFKLLMGQMTVPPAWLGMEKGKGIIFPAVKFVATKHPLAKQLAKAKRQLSNRLAHHATPVGVSSGLYVIRASRQSDVQQHVFDYLNAIQLQLMETLEQERSAMREDFIQRFKSAVKDFSSRRQLSDVDLEGMAIQAGENFDLYVENNPFGVTVEFGIPLANLSDPFDPLAQAILAEKARSPLAFPDRE